MARLLGLTVIGALFLALTACSDGEPDRAVLDARAVLPADTFTAGPPVGAARAGEFNGRTLPVDSPPVQGFSSLVALPDGRWLALQDNGFGTLANSPDYPLQFFVLDLDLAAGTVAVADAVSLHDPDRALGFPHAADRLFGNDLDPESCARLDDGTLWIGEEFGPYLVHVDPAGRVLEPAVPVPVPFALGELARGAETYRTPDHPDLRALPEDQRLAAANLPRSGGLEGLTRTPDGTRLYAAVEKALRDDPVPERRVLLEFDPAARIFTGRTWYYRVDEPGLSIASLEAFTATILLVVERDAEEGPAARIKRIYRVDLDDRDAEGYLPKTLVCDLLDLADPHGLTAPEPGAHGLGPDFAFPYVTPECLAILDARTLLVANDNNYPFSAGRRAGVPDDNEFVRVVLGRGLE